MFVHPIARLAMATDLFAVLERAYCAQVCGPPEIRPRLRTSNPLASPRRGRLPRPALTRAYRLVRFIRTDRIVEPTARYAVSAVARTALDSATLSKVPASVFMM